ncbi:Quinoprotein amine dehydrogenase, beta chain-like protein [Kalmanozyma brasiliensis GHG001]|nr:Quinoprotein amine dehydrogenase, beta chain-like protein [Kalmanozyma brasiliensis GHG001]EST10087.2 Quinoprotein amine dehydrogenase, beta chain-like protein [Kalmanozyma brasiliensis GHG001]
MTTATPLSLPFILDQKDHTTSSHSYRRRWKPDRPNYRTLLSAQHAEGSSGSAASRAATTAKISNVQADPDQLEADLQEWGLPSTSSGSRLAPPTSAISWDENSAKASCSYLQNRRSTDLSPATATSLDQWDPSISFAPYSSSGLAPIPLSGSSSEPLRYDPSLGRVLAVGRDDGTVTIYRAYGRVEDYDSLSSKDPQTAEADDALPASASASASMSRSASQSASVRSSAIASPTRLRSPEAATPSIRLSSSAASHATTASGREPSPLLAAFSPIDRSSAARSTISTASAHSAVAANVQLDDGLPANSLQSMVNATGHTAGRKFGDEAENRLEQQMAAAERNDHQHGVVGGVIERLGFSSHPHAHSHSPSSHHQSSRESSRHHGSRPSGSRHSPITPPRASTSIETLAAIASQSQAQEKTLGPATPDRGDASLQTSASDAWLHEPSRGSFSQTMTLYTRDRSPVVALRSIPSMARTQESNTAPWVSATAGLETAALLIVQEAGTISSWSISEGTIHWQSDLASAQVVPTGVESSDATTKESSATLGMMHSLSKLPSAIGTSRTHSPAGSARASPKPTLLAGDASMRRSLLRTALSGADAETTSRLREIRAVKLCEAVQTLNAYGTSVALVWDSHSSSVFLLGLLDGTVLLRETLDDVLPASVPTLCLLAESQERVHLTWFSESQRKLEKQLVRILTSEATKATPQDDTTDQGKQLKGFVFDAKAEAQPSSDGSWTLSDDAGQAQKIHVLQHQVVVQSSECLSVLDSARGQVRFTQEAGTDSIKRICGSSRNSELLLVQSSSALAKLHLNGTRAGTSVVKVPTLTPVARPPSCRLPLAWNLPGSGNLLEKAFLFQPTATDDLGTSAAPQESAEVVAFDLSTSQIEDLLASRGSDPDTSLVAESGSRRAGPITAVLPLSLEKIAVASDGGLRLLSLSSIASQTAKSSTMTATGNNLGPDHEICLLRSAVAPRSGQRLIVGGTLHGELGFWQANATATQGEPPSEPQLEATLSVSTTPVEALLVFGDDDNTIRLHGCLACICADSSVTIVLLEGFRLQYTIPGRGARLTSLAVRADELLLTYDDGKARVWDLRTQELRRSIAVDQAQALVEDGKGWWTVKPIEPYSPLHSGTSGVLSQLASARDGAAASLLVDFRRSIEAAARSVRGAGPSTAKEDAAPRIGQPNATGQQPPAALRSEQEQYQTDSSASVSLGSPAARKAVNIIRPLLPTVFPTGLDSDIDAKLAALLDLESNAAGGLGHSAFTVGALSASDALMVGDSDGKFIGEASRADFGRAWKLSSRLTTTRLMVASALLRVLSHVSELKRLAEDLQRFVEDEAHLSSLVGVGFRGVQLTELAPYWLDSNMELQNASRSMFQAAVTRLGQAQLDVLCDQWQTSLSPAKTAQDNAKTRMADIASEDVELQIRALALLGSIAVERYTSMSPRLLKDIAKAIHGSIVSDKGSEMRSSHELQMLAVAIELCRQGFSMWQHYFDATEVVRSLFALSTSTSTSSSTSADSDLRTLARAATLQIAAENTPLFMTTLSLDILHARSAAHCSATMRLVAFMVRKRPSVLVANLPRLAEAVVKSLDPTHTTMREAVVNAATVMIGELVSTYPSLSFFGGGQRLAVGTHEGAVIMYDLKTATRLYVLEGHRRRADAVSFSPDGRRLVTMSLEEGRVLVWKTSSGFSTFFSPGQMPRQGATDVKLTDGAYKAFLFNVGEQHQSASKAGTTQAATFGCHQGENQEQDFVGFDRIRFQWNSERSVKVQIGEAQLNISVD